MHTHIINLSNLTYQERLPLINYLKAKGEPIYKQSSIFRDHVAPPGTGLIFNELTKQWAIGVIWGRKTISINAFIDNQITFKDL